MILIVFLVAVFWCVMFDLIVDSYESPPVLPRTAIHVLITIGAMSAFARFIQF